MLMFSGFWTLPYVEVQRKTEKDVAMDLVIKYSMQKNVGSNVFYHLILKYFLLVMSGFFKFQ